MNRSIKIVALTDAGLSLAKKLAAQLEGSELWFKPKPFAEKVQRAFSAGNGLILICATGIAVRTLAPVINSKSEDPPVLILDESGEFVIPLLSGHEGGANDWAASIAKLIGAQLVMTTANSYLKPIYAVGMGCERGCSQEDLAQLLDACLAQAGIDIKQVDSINSIDVKADEVGLLELAKNLNKPFQTFSVESLLVVENLLSTKSEYVFNTVGVYGVAESAALVAAMNVTNNNAELALVKQKTTKATCAIARSYPKNSV
ncbi:cobalt-precorrin 5A hydrolase [Halioglobus sp. Uisw_031]|jgi:cobalt-precorrin 5A hydrolase|uniref:cobalt-precorrin 5A hydrolase n=1 Tax=Halioglobus sp. Uisw_031 TaxID=3230977 RepID=UPI0039E86201